MNDRFWAWVGGVLFIGILTTALIVSCNSTPTYVSPSGGGTVIVPHVSFWHRQRYLPIYHPAPIVIHTTPVLTPRPSFGVQSRPTFSPRPTFGGSSRPLRSSPRPSFGGSGRRR